jgi:hypothetical protein
MEKAKVNRIMSKVVLTALRMADRRIRSVQKNRKNILKVYTRIRRRILETNTNQ